MLQVERFGIKILGVQERSFDKLMPNARNTKSKYWVWTLNNYTGEEEEKLTGERCELLSYILFGREVGESGTPHLQGYLECTRRVRVSQLKKIPGLQRAHFEPRRGTYEEAADYCRKDDPQPYESGEPSGTTQGKRTDLEEVKEKIDNGASTLTIAQEHFGSFCRYRKSFAEYRRLITPVDTREVEVHIIWGKPGTGKTRIVWDCFKDDLWINCDPSLAWFDGYQGQSVVLLDDYRGGCAKEEFLLRLLDRYPFQVQIKGGWVPWIPTKIFITSNIAPPFGHHGIEEPFRRRVKGVIKLDLNIYREGAEQELEHVKSLII